MGEEKICAELLKTEQSGFTDLTVEQIRCNARQKLGSEGGNKTEIRRLMTIQQYSSVCEIVDKYDAFIIDLWGVIHDGRVAYEGVHECLQQIMGQGKRVIFLSNAPRRAIRAIEGLERLNITSDYYHHVVTSGQVAYEYIKSGEHDLGAKYYMIGPERDAGMLEGTAGYDRVMDLGQADFAIATGFKDDSSTIDEVMGELQQCKERELTVICANPDMLVVRQTGVKALCAGVIAQQYDKMGGKVISFGKPYSSVYERAFGLIADIKKERIAAIGDNLQTDIKGANDSNIDSYLIAGGILGEALGIEHGKLPDQDKLSTVCQKYNIFPSAILPAFIWK